MKLGPRRSYARLALVTAIAITTLAACSSPARPHAKPVALDEIVTAMTAARSGRVHGTTLGPNGQPVAALDGTWSGGLSGTSDVNTAVRSTSGALISFEVRLVAKQFYVRRAAMLITADDPARLFTRPPNAKPWRAYRVGGGVIDAFPSAFSPLALVQWIDRLRIQTTVRGHEQIAGRPVTHLVTKRRTLVGPWLRSSVDLWVDASFRLVRARVSSAAGGVEYDVSGSGAPVSVAAPPASEISTTTEVVPIEPSGAFVAVASGHDGGVAWTVERAPGTQDTVCWRWIASQPLPQANLVGAGRPRCLSTPTPPVAPADSIQFPVIGNPRQGYDALVVVLPADVRQLTLGFVGGATTRLVPRRLLVWVGPSQPLKAYLGVVLADGTHIDCGAGAVSRIDDLTNPRFTETVPGAAWACLPPS